MEIEIFAFPISSSGQSTLNEERADDEVASSSTSTSTVFPSVATTSADAPDASLLCSSSSDIDFDLHSTDVAPLTAKQEPELNITNVKEEAASLVVESSVAATVSTDPAKWLINDTTIAHLFSKEIDQNLDEDFSVTRTFSKSMNAYCTLSKSVFYRPMLNGQKVNRKYLCYSPSKKALFCIPCRLFGGTSKLGTEGFTDWDNVNAALNQHENSNEHNYEMSYRVFKSK